MNRKKTALIVAGGTGTRMGAEIPKQFLEIGGKPILHHTIERFLEYDPKMAIVVVLPSGSREWWREYTERTGFLERYAMPSGGITRFHSVQNALKYVPDGSIVAVHDGVRPCITVEFLASLFEAARGCDALVPVLPEEESLRELSDDGSRAVDRRRFVRVQTPQIFPAEVLKEAYKQAYSPTFTDDASVVEAAGYVVKLTDGLKGNIKITTPFDLTVSAPFLCGT